MEIPGALNQFQADSGLDLTTSHWALKKSRRRSDGWFRRSDKTKYKREHHSGEETVLEEGEEGSGSSNKPFLESKRKKRGKSMIAGSMPEKKDPAAPIVVTSPPSRTPSPPLHRKSGPMSASPKDDFVGHRATHSSAGLLQHTPEHHHTALHQKAQVKPKRSLGHHLRSVALDSLSSSTSSKSATLTPTDSLLKSSSGSGSPEKSSSSTSASPVASHDSLQGSHPLLWQKRRSSGFGKRKGLQWMETTPIR